MRVAVCSSLIVVSTFFAASAMAQAPAAPPPGAPPPGAPPPPAYGPPPPGYYYGPPPPNPNQERTAFNNIFVEGLGPGLFYSFNYERIISDIGIRAGIGYISLGASSASGQSSAHAYFLTVPFDINYIGIGGKKHIFELGGGVTIAAVGAGVSSLGVESNESTTFFYGHLNMGYRMQPPTGGFMMRAGISPIIGSGLFLPWPYISLGAAF
jgi:hypothetical protein